MVEHVIKALGTMSTATLWATEGTADIGVNRRNNDESQIDTLLASGEPPKGPVDHRVPLLAVRGSDGALQAAKPECLPSLLPSLCLRSAYRMSLAFPVPPRGVVWG